MKSFQWILAIVMAVAATGCSVIGPGQRGIRISLGTVSNDLKEPGAYAWFPSLLGMVKINVQIQKSEVEASAASKDMQEITTHVALNWSLAPEKVIDTYKTIGDEDDVLTRIISPAINEVLKATAAQRNAEEALTQRLSMKNEIDTQLKARLATYGITVHDLSIVNFKFTDEFEKAIERKQIAEQEAKQAGYDAAKALQQAKAQVNRAQGEADSQKLVRATLTAEILQQRAIEKWDGHFPQVMGSGTMPFLNLNLK